jgi:hypothetical protein
MKVSLLVRKSLKALRASFMVWLLLCEDSTYMACNHVTVRWFIGAVMDQF